MVSRLVAIELSKENVSLCFILEHREVDQNSWYTGKIIGGGWWT